MQEFNRLSQTVEIQGHQLDELKKIIQSMTETQTDVVRRALAVLKARELAEDDARTGTNTPSTPAVTVEQLFAGLKIAESNLDTVNRLTEQTVPPTSFASKKPEASKSGLKKHTIIKKLQCVVSLLTIGGLNIYIYI